MRNTVEAALQTDGALQFSKSVRLAAEQLVLVTFTDVQDESLSGAQFSQQTLSTDWLRKEEDEAWAHLQANGSRSAGLGAWWKLAISPRCRSSYTYLVDKRR